MLERLWTNLVGRLHGPLRFRLLLQPTVAGVLAVRAGLADARAGRAPYLWSVVRDAQHRRDLLRQGWCDVAKVFVLAVALDTTYQSSSCAGSIPARRCSSRRSWRWSPTC
jgi:hypothetical protein